MDLISEKLNNKLNELVGKCFEMNRMLDRGMSLLKVRWGLINTSDILHEKVAHAYPSDKFADAISDYQSLRGMETIYPYTPAGNKEYKNVLDFFYEYDYENKSFENMIKDAIDIAEEEGDCRTKDFLNKILKNLSYYTSLSEDLIKIFSNCENDKFKLMIVDSFIDKYVTV